MPRRRPGPWIALALIAAMPLAAAAQRGGFSRFGVTEGVNVPYNGQFTFTRISYGGGGFGFGFRGFGRSAWNHDYPQADVNLPLILEALTSVRPNLNVSNIYALEDPEIFRNPVIYMWEPGFWSISDEAAGNLRAYMLKGGFIIFDDFEANQWFNFEEQFRRALPDAQFIRLDPTHALFHAFFDMDEINVPHPTVRVVPEYFGVFENNDPNGRMMALVNYNNDVAEYWEYSGTGRFAVDTTNDAYKLGVNYMIYALMH
jgi:hypothetical protein